jgi:hypothetical protein
VGFAEFALGISARFITHATVGTAVSSFAETFMSSEQHHLIYQALLAVFP